MAQYIKFESSTGPILVEVQAEETSASSGVVKAGIKEKVQGTVAAAQTSFEDAVQGLVRHNAQLFVAAVLDMPRAPNAMEVTFGLKATGEVGNMAVAKAGGEANYTIKLTWKGTDGGT